jgi:cellulose synthase/poly-beta-1,6-N-acetylglucosamine synthase-like glycosyltransferase
MQALRIAGVILGLVGFVLTWLVRFRLRRLRNLDWLIGSALSLLLLLLGLFPDLFNAFLGFFSFEEGGGGRLIGLLVFSNLVLYLLNYVALSRSSKAEQLIDRLVREMAKREFRKAHDPDKAPIYVIVPAYNEAENIGAVLEGIPPKVLGLGTKPLVVVDGATDETEDVVKQLNNVAISHVINRGGGAALKAGYEIAVERGAEIVVTLDADGQHLPEEIPVVVRPILDGEADLVNGSRVLGHYEKGNRLRAAGVVLFNWLVSALTLTRITDCSNAFRAIRAEELPRLELSQRQFHTTELLIDALKKGLRVKEVPITIRRRMSGETKKPPSLKYALGFTQAIVKTWLR